MATRQQQPDKATTEPQKQAAETSAEMSVEDIQREIALVELQTKKLQLEEAKKNNAAYLEAEKQRSKRNRQRQGELKQIAQAEEAVVKKCRHKSGGNPKDVLRGGGIGSFSIISRALMPDGVTVFLQCARCRMKIYFRPLSVAEEAKLQKADPQMHSRYLEGKRLHETSIEDGLEHAELRGPTFFFQNSEGVPIIPDRV